MLYKNTETTVKQSPFRQPADFSNEENEFTVSFVERIQFSNDNTPLVLSNHNTDEINSKTALKETIKSLQDMSQARKEREILAFEIDVKLVKEAELEYKRDLIRFNCHNLSLASFFNENLEDNQSRNTILLTRNKCHDEDKQNLKEENNKFKDHEGAVRVFRNSFPKHHTQPFDENDFSVIKRKGLTFHEDGKGDQQILTESTKKQAKSIKYDSLDLPKSQSDMSESCDDIQPKNQVILKTQESQTCQDIEDAYAFINLVNEANNGGDPDHLVQHSIMNDMIYNMQRHHEAIEAFKKGTEFKSSQILDNEENWIQHQTLNKRLFSSSESWNESETNSVTEPLYCL